MPILKKRLASLLFAFLCACAVQAQTFYYRSYGLEKEMAWVEPTVAQRESDVLIDLQKEIQEAAQDAKEEFVYRRITHMRYKVLSEKGVAGLNSLSLAFPTGTKLSACTVRTMTAKGAGLYILPDASYQRTSADGVDKIDIPVPGLQIGSQVEYLIITDQAVRFSGAESFQQAIPTNRAEFTVALPSWLRLRAKLYNIAHGTIQDTVLGDTRLMEVRVQDLPAIPEETAAYDEAYEPFCLYTLEENKHSGLSNFTTWDVLARNAYKNTRLTEEADRKVVTKLIKQLKLAGIAPLEQMLVLENHIKTNIQVNRDRQNSQSLAQIFKSKSADELEIIRLYVEAARQLAIPTEIVMTRDRSELIFDSAFAHEAYIREILIHLPSLDGAGGKYISPFVLNQTLLSVDEHISGQKALFVKTVKFGQMEYGAGEIRQVAFLKPEENVHEQRIQARLLPESKELEIEIVRKLSGQQYSFYKRIYDLIPPDRQLELRKSNFPDFVSDKTPAQLTAHHTSLSVEDYQKPFQLELRTSLTGLVQKGGNSYIIKLGELIGKQVAVIIDKPRRLPYELGCPHRLHHIIELAIPAGYKLSGAADLAQELTMPGDVAHFRVSQRQEGDKLIVDIEEIYRKATFSVAEFESVLKPLNASAAFNQKVVVLEKM